MLHRSVIRVSHLGADREGIQQVTQLVEACVNSLSAEDGDQAPSCQLFEGRDQATLFSPLRYFRRATKIIPGGGHCGRVWQDTEKR
jgi:hypothetical protein